MSEEETKRVYEGLRKKYPGMSDEQLADIMRTGAEHGLIEVTSAPASSKSAEEEEGGPEFDVLKALKGGGADLDEIIRFMIIDNWLKERFGKGKVPPEIQELIDKAKSAKKDGGDLDGIMDKTMKYEMIQSFIDSRKAKNQPPPQPTVDVEKAIRDVGAQMAEALKTHKLEDEKEKANERADQERKRADDAEKRLHDHERTQEEDRRLETRVRERTAPIEAKYDALIKEIGNRLKNVPADERSGLMLDLGQVITEEVGETIKKRVIDGVQKAFTGEEPSAVTAGADGSPQINWYKLGERGLRTLEKFIEKMPTHPPERREVKTIPHLPPTPGTPGPSSQGQPGSGLSGSTREGSGKQEVTAIAVTEENPIIPEKTKREGKAAEKSTSEQSVAGERSQEPRKTDQQQQTERTG
jgi:hypothetical protein